MTLATRFTPPSLLVGTRATITLWGMSPQGDWIREEEAQANGHFVHLGLTDERVSQEFTCEIRPEWEYRSLSDGEKEGVLRGIYLRVRTPGGRILDILENGEVRLVEEEETA